MGEYTFKFSPVAGSSEAADKTTTEKVPQRASDAVNFSSPTFVFKPHVSGNNLLNPSSSPSGDIALFESPKDFVNTFLPLYQTELANNNISADFAQYLLAQVALESAWGKRPAGWREGVVTNNYIGEKEVRSGVKGHAMGTHEYDSSGKKIQIKDSFRIFDSIPDMVRFHVRKFLGKRWQTYNIYNADDVGGFGKRVKAAGYATDPNYAEKITNTAQQILKLISK